MLKEYMEETRKTSVYPGANERNIYEVAYLALGLAGETGEAVDVIKKGMREGATSVSDMKPERLEKLKGELGDVIWYWIRLCDTMHFNPYEVIQENIDKLRDRKVKGTLKDR